MARVRRWHGIRVGRPGADRNFALRLVAQALVVMIDSSRILNDPDAQGGSWEDHSVLFNSKFVGGLEGWGIAFTGVEYTGNGQYTQGNWYSASTVVSGSYLGNGIQVFSLRYHARMPS